MQVNFELFILETILKAVFQGMCPEQGLVNLGFHGDCNDCIIVSPDVPIARHNVTLGGRFVMISAPRFNKGSEVVVLRVNGDAVIAIPCIEAVFFLTCEMDLAWWKGESVWCVSLFAWALRGWKSTFRHGFPFFFVQITIQWHHVTGSSTGTGSRTPRWIFWIRPAFTSYCQWSGMGMGVWWATGFAVSSIISSSRGPTMRERGWWSHTLNVLDLLSRMHCCIFSCFLLSQRMLHLNVEATGVGDAGSGWAGFRGAGLILQCGITVVNCFINLGEIWGGYGEGPRKPLSSRWCTPFALFQRLCRLCLWL